MEELTTWRALGFSVRKILQICLVESTYCPGILTRVPYELGWDQVIVRNSVRSGFRVGGEAVSTPLPGSVTRNFHALMNGDRDALHWLWNRYYNQLVRMASAQLSGVIDRVSDAEDLASTTLYELHDGVDRGRFETVRNRNELWRLLVSISRNQARMTARRSMTQKRDASRLFDWLGEPADGAQVEGRDPGPAEAALVADQCRVLLSVLDEADPSGALRRVAIHRLEGFSNSEIAKSLGCARKTVAVRLALIQNLWKPHLSHEHSLTN